MRLEPGARKCFLIWTTAGEKMPERTDEQGETVRLKEEGEVTRDGCAVDHLFSLSDPSDRTDSRDEAMGVKMSAELVGLVLSSDTGAVFAKKSELKSESPAVSQDCLWEGLLC